MDRRMETSSGVAASCLIINGGFGERVTEIRQLFCWSRSSSEESRLVGPVEEAISQDAVFLQQLAYYVCHCNLPACLGYHVISAPSHSCPGCVTGPVPAPQPRQRRWAYARSTSEI